MSNSRNSQHSDMTFKKFTRVLVTNNKFIKSFSFKNLHPSLNPPIIPQYNLIFVSTYSKQLVKYMKN